MFTTASPLAKGADLKFITTPLAKVRRVKPGSAISSRLTTFPAGPKSA